MRRVTKKQLAAGTVVLSLLTGFAGCGARDTAEVPKEQDVQETQDTEANASDAAEEITPAWKTLGQSGEKVTFDWYVNFSWYGSAWGGNVVSDKITEDTGVDINFITPMGNEQEKLNSLIASDSLPDLITLGYWESALDDMINNGQVYALNELADLYDPYFYQVSDPTAVSWYTQEDGNIYSYPNASTTPQDMEGDNDISSNITFLVRKDIYEAIGSPDMTTREGFYAAVKKAAEMFPEVDGNPLIPIGAHTFDETGSTSFDSYLMDFLAVDWERDGKSYDRFTDPEYISWLKMFRQLGEEGYLRNEIFSDTRVQMSEKLEKGQYFCMIYQYSDIVDQQNTLYQNNPNSIYMAVEGPRNSNGADPKLPVSSVNGWTVTLISKNCKDPKRAIAFMDYMLSEYGQKILYLGVEGETYETVDGKPVLYDDVKNLMHTDRTAFEEQYGADDTYWMLMDTIMQKQWDQDSSEAMAQIEEWSKKYAVYDGEYDYDFPSESEAAIITSNVNQLWSETIPKLLLAESDSAFDAIMADFTEQREQIGYEKLLEEQTAYFTKAKEKLGVQGENGVYTFVTE